MYQCFAEQMYLICKLIFKKTFPLVIGVSGTKTKLKVTKCLKAKKVLVEL